MYLRTGILGLVLFSPYSFAAEQAPQQVPLVVPAGVPLRLYLTRRVPKREGAPVEAKVFDPVYFTGEHAADSARRRAAACAAGT